MAPSESPAIDSPEPVQDVAAGSTALAEPAAVDQPLAVVPTDAVEAVSPALPPRRPHRRFFVDLGHPFGWGFTATVGALVALALASAVSSLSTVMVSIGVALFVSLALEPLVRWLESKGMSRGLAIAVVFTVFAVLFAGILAIVIPLAVVQITQFAGAAPGYITSIQQSEWFQNIVNATGQSDLYQSVLNQVRSWLSNPTNLLAIGGGALAVGSGVVTAVSGTLIVLVLTLYFLASMSAMKNALNRLAPAYGRPQLARITDQLADSVGGYVSGMAILALCNAVFAFILLSILGVPFAALLAVLALMITMIPMVGSVLFWLTASVVAMFTSWWVGLIFAGVYFAYMQIEAYVMTPRVMTKAVDVPGALVLIGAMVGGTLLGLLGALVAVPVTASLLMIVNEVFIPRQDAKLVPDD